MARAEKLYRRFRDSRGKNVHFHDLCTLAEKVGFSLVREKGSHRIYKHPGIGQRLNLQPKAGDAKPYQVKQLLNLIEDHELMG